MSAPQHPPGLMVSGETVLLSGAALDTARKAGAIAALNRKRHGLPDAEYVALVRACETALTEPVGTSTPKTVTRCNRFTNAGVASNRNHGADDLSATGQPDTGAAQHWFSTREAAQQLGCSDRTARRIAKRVGHRFGGRAWLIPADALPEQETA